MFIDFLFNVFRESTKAEAVIWRDQSFAYDKLLQRTNDWSHYLHQNRIGSGTVVAKILAGAATDAAGLLSRASTSTDNTVTFSPAPTDVGMTNTMPDPNAPDWTALGAQGLKTWDVVQGTGDPLQTGDSIMVFYTGWLAANGTQFDAKRIPSAPASFNLNGLIQGWQQGLIGMRPGGIRRLFVPSALGYGTAGSGTNIPPNADLVFEIKLVSHT